MLSTCQDAQWKKQIKDIMHGSQRSQLIVIDKKGKVSCCWSAQRHGSHFQPQDSFFSIVWRNKRCKNYSLSHS